MIIGFQWFQAWWMLDAFNMITSLDDYWLFSSFSKFQAWWMPDAHWLFVFHPFQHNFKPDGCRMLIGCLFFILFKISSLMDAGCSLAVCFSSFSKFQAWWMLDAHWLFVFHPFQHNFKPDGCRMLIGCLFFILFKISSLMDAGCSLAVCFSSFSKFQAWWMPDAHWLFVFHPFQNFKPDGCRMLIGCLFFILLKISSLMDAGCSLAVCFSSFSKFQAWWMLDAHWLFVFHPFQNFKPDGCRMLIGCLFFILFNIISSMVDAGW